MLKWVIAEEELDLQDSFELEANGRALRQLEYLAPSFKLIDEDPAFFDASLTINDKEVRPFNFEWRQGTLSHKIAEAIQDDPA